MSLRTFIQYKGTDLCMDFECECGETYHIDGSFAYGLHCHVCDKVWVMPQDVSSLIKEATPEFHLPTLDL